MSSLLKEAIVDAQALKEAALKNAEAAIIEKYSNEVKETIDKLLEQDDFDAALAGVGTELADDLDDDLGVEPMEEEVEEVTEDEIPLAAADGLSQEVGVGLEEAPNEGQEVEFNVNLGALQEAIAELRSELEEDEQIEITEEELSEILDEEVEEVETPGAETMQDANLEEGEEKSEFPPKKPEESNREYLERVYGQMKPGENFTDFVRRIDPLDPPTSSQRDPDAGTGWEGVTAGDVRGEWDNVNEDISEELVDAIMEKLTVDMGATLSGWAGRSSEDMKFEMEKEFAHRRSTEVEEEMEELKKAQEELVFENSQLKERNQKYEEAVTQLQENLQDINLSNARLLYTNRVLRNTSLNERQKEKIVEAISNAGSVTEAKTIFNTLQSTMEAKPTKQSPQSLSEALGRRPSTLRASRKEVKPVDTMSERMKKLAGIK